MRTVTRRGGKTKAIGLAALIGLTSGFASSALAEAPVAIVEDVGAGVAGLEFMDYLVTGQVIRLDPGASVTLSYMRSCVREKIVGGVIVVGADRSAVTNGSVERTTVDCDAGKMTLTAQQAEQAAGLVDRTPANGQRKIRVMPKSQLTLYGSSPVVAVDGGGALVIEPLGGAGERLVVTIGERRGGAFYDFAGDGKSLAAGGVYRAIFGGRQIVFRIDPDAKAGRTPIIGRLIRFESAR